MPEPFRARIRSADEDDADALSRLYDVIGHPLDPAGVRERVAAFRRARDHRYFVAEVDGEVVGFATAQTSESPSAPGRYGVVSAMAISDTHQRQGIGKQLLAAVETWMLSEGCLYVRVTSASHRTETAHRFYPALGYRRTGVRFEKDLTTP